MPALPAEKVSLFFLVEPAFSYISHYVIVSLCFSFYLSFCHLYSFITVVVFFPQFYDVLPLLHPKSTGCPVRPGRLGAAEEERGQQKTGDVAGISCGLHTYDNALYIYYNHNHIQTMII